MRTGKVLIAGLMLAFVSAGCAAGPGDGDGVATAGSPGATADPTPTRTVDEDTPLKFAQCMRKNGMTWFPDPDPNGRTVVRTPKGLDPKKFDAAREACQEFAPDGGNAGRLDPELIEQSRRLAKCMRENGVPGFPDPQPDGSVALRRDKDGGGIDPGDPAFQQAEQKCSQYLPGPRREGQDSGGDSGTTGVAR